MGDFIHANLTAGSDARPRQKPTAYLAQHPLLTQLPSLRADIAVPDLCYTSPPRRYLPGSHVEEDEDDEEPRLNAWFGPAGTITPLHTDPSHNLLAQVVGRKYVRLYDPQAATDAMRPRGKDAGGVDMGNTSSWDVGAEEGWDERQSSTDGDAHDGSGDELCEGSSTADTQKFSDIPFVDCILEPGDTLYIPLGWWHYVRGLTVSFSVSFWWN
jgi:lysine-specific demethylase 8